MVSRKRPFVYFANRLDTLTTFLASELWQKGEDPFAEKLVILPHRELKSYINGFFAKMPEIGISAGISYFSLVEGIKYLAGEEHSLFSREALIVAFESEIRKILSEEDEQFASVCSYVGSFAGEEKIRALAEELGALFWEYGTYEPKLFVEKRKETGWRQAILSRVLSKYPDRKFLTDLLSGTGGQDRKIHLFGFSHLSRSFVDFFCRFSARFYVPSPGEMFWEDLCSDRERIYLEKKMEKKGVSLCVQEQLRFFLTKTHPLLAEWGKAGRPFLAALGEKEAYLEEGYVKDYAPGVLGHIQESLMELEDGSEPKKPLDPEDDSLLRIAAPSRLREVEIVSNTLIRLLATQKKQPKDVLVFVSDLDRYLPYIRTVFGAEESPFFYSFGSVSSDIDLRKGVCSFLPLLEERFSLESVFAFLSLPSVAGKSGFSPEEIGFLRQRFSEVGVVWGLSPEYKKRRLETTVSPEMISESVVKKGTWSEGINAVLRGLALEEESSFDSTRIELLDRFLLFWEGLQRDLAPFYEEAESSFIEKHKTLRQFAERYLLLDESDRHILRESETIARELLPEPVSCSLFFRSLRSLANRFKHSINGSNLQAIRFLPLESGVIASADIFVVLGCDEEIFFRSPALAFSEGKIEKKENPSEIEKKGYLFLELICRAKRSLIISYTERSVEDGKNIAPCRPCQTLFSYVDRRFFTPEGDKLPSQILQREHPVFPFGKEYFSGVSNVVSFSSKDYAAATAYYGKQGDNAVSFFSEDNTNISEIFSEPMAIDIIELREFAKNPVSRYCKKNIGFFFPFLLEEDRDFFFPSREKNREVRKQLTGQSNGSLFPRRFPEGIWGEIAGTEIERETESMKRNLAAIGVSFEEVFSLEFVSGLRSPEMMKERRVYPSPRMETALGPVLPFGRVPYVTEKGMLWFGPYKKEEYFLLWPTFLLYLIQAEQAGWEKCCFFPKEGKTFAPEIGSPVETLCRYLEVYLRSLTEPCPVLPKIGFSVLEEDRNGIVQKMNPGSYDFGFTDPYESWAQKRTSIFAADRMLERWGEDWKRAFAPLRSSPGDPYADV